MRVSLPAVICTTTGMSKITFQKSLSKTPIIILLPLRKNKTARKLSQRKQDSATRNKYYRGTCKTSGMGGAASSLPAICRCSGNEDVAPPRFCKCLNHVCGRKIIAGRSVRIEKRVDTIRLSVPRHNASNRTPFNGHLSPSDVITVSG